jgi:hypothetical protein
MLVLYFDAAHNPKQLGVMSPGITGGHAGSHMAKNVWDHERHRG